MAVELEFGGGEVGELLRAVSIPRGVRVAQRFDAAPALGDMREAVRAALGGVTLPTGNVAVGVGSRGVARIGEIVAALVAELKAAGAHPFVVPAMGSHGASTAEGQADVLTHLGVSEATVGAPVRATMNVVEIGKTPAGLPVYMDENAFGADAIVVVSRVKPHTAFRGPVESGPAKMLAIGLGKQRGAHVLHAAGWDRFHETVPQAAAVALGTGKVAFALATIENQHDEPFHLEALPAATLLAREPALLEMAKKSIARLPFDALDVLVIDRIGKNVSGDGADPNVTGRYPTPYGTGGPRVERMVFLDLTDETLGNANGIGLADVVTTRLAERFSPGATYPNALTSTVSETVRMPMTLPSPRLALAAALMMVPGLDSRNARIVRILDTMHLSELWVSEPLLPEVRRHPMLSLDDELGEFPLPVY
jgi:hypothetical protein